MNNPKDVHEGIPPFLQRAPATAPGVSKPESESVMSDVNVEAPAEAPVKAPRKPRSKPAKAAKPTKVAKPAKAAKPAVKAAKAQPKASKVKRDEFGIKVGTVKHKAVQMYASKRGATLAEVKDKVGSLQLNVLTDLAAKGFKVKREKSKGKGGRVATRYFLIAK